MNPMNLFGNKDTKNDSTKLDGIEDFKTSKLLSSDVVIGIDNRKIMTIDNKYLLVYVRNKIYKVRTDSNLFVSIMAVLSELPLVVPFTYLTVKGEKALVASEGLASANTIEFREKMLNGDYGNCELVEPSTLIRFIGNSEFKLFSAKPKEKLVIVPIWNGNAVILESKGIAIWFDEQVSIAIKGDKLYGGIADILSCMEVNSKFVFINVTPESIALTKPTEITEQMKEFRESLAFGEYGKYELKKFMEL